MTHDEQMRAKIEDLFHTRPWAGAISLNQAITYSLAYRDSLSLQEREVYDEQLLMERHPSKVQELIEIMRERGCFATQELAAAATGS